MANRGKLEPIETTKTADATNADGLLTDSLDLGKEQLMGKVYPIDHTVNITPEPIPTIPPQHRSCPYYIESVVLDGSLVTTEFENYPGVCRIRFVGFGGDATVVYGVSEIEVLAQMLRDTAEAMRGEF
jgi:hypothetical protein